MSSNLGFNYSNKVYKHSYMQQG